MIKQLLTGLVVSTMFVSPLALAYAESNPAALKSGSTILLQTENGTQFEAMVNKDAAAKLGALKKGDKVTLMNDFDFNGKDSKDGQRK